MSDSAPAPIVQDSSAQPAISARWKSDGWVELWTAQSEVTSVSKLIVQGLKRKAELKAALLAQPFTRLDLVEANLSTLVALHGALPTVSVWDVAILIHFSVDGIFAAMSPFGLEVAARACAALFAAGAASIAIWGDGADTGVLAKKLGLPFRPAGPFR